MSSEVKGSFFVSVRAHLERTDPDGLARLIAKMPAEHRKILEDPIASAWYPEAALGAMFAAIHQTVARNDRAEFARLMEAFTEVGLGKFFKVFLKLTSARFVLRQGPIIWKQLRRGAGEVEVLEDDAFVDVRYSHFPPLRDPLYEVGTVASVRTMVRLCTGRDPVVKVTNRPPDALWLRIEL